MTENPNVVKSRYQGKAKHIIVWENGDFYGDGHDIAINPNYYRTWNRILAFITDTLRPSFGAVRNLINMDTKEPIQSFESLESNGRYIAVGADRLKADQNVKSGYKTRAEKQEYQPRRYYPDAVTGQPSTSGIPTRGRKTILFVMTNGKTQEMPCKIVLTESDFESWGTILEYVARTLDIPESIQYLYTIFGDPVMDPRDLQNGCIYVAVPITDRFFNLNYVRIFKSLLPMREIDLKRVEGISAAPPQISDPIIPSRQTFEVAKSKSEGLTNIRSCTRITTTNQKSTQNGQAIDSRSRKSTTFARNQTEVSQARQSGTTPIPSGTTESQKKRFCAGAATKKKQSLQPSKIYAPTQYGRTSVMQNKIRPGGISKTEGRRRTQDLQGYNVLFSGESFDENSVYIQPTIPSLTKDARQTLQANLPIIQEDASNSTLSLDFDGTGSFEINEDARSISEVLVPRNHLEENLVNIAYKNQETVPEEATRDQKSKESKSITSVSGKHAYIAESSPSKKDIPEGVTVILCPLKKAKSASQSEQGIADESDVRSSSPLKDIPEDAKVIPCPLKKKQFDSESDNEITDNPIERSSSPIKDIPEGAKVFPCQFDSQSKNEITDKPIVRSSSPIKDIPAGAKVIPCSQKKRNSNSQSETKITDNSTVRFSPPIKEIPEGAKVVPSPIKKRKSGSQSDNEITDKGIARSSSPIKDIPEGAKVIPCPLKKKQFDSQNENETTDELIVRSSSLIKDIPEGAKVIPPFQKTRNSYRQFETGITDNSTVICSPPIKETPEGAKVVPYPLKKRKSDSQSDNEISDYPTGRSSSPIKDIPDGAKVIPCPLKKKQFDSESDNEITDNPIERSSSPIKDIPKGGKVISCPQKKRHSYSQSKTEITDNSTVILSPPIKETPEGAKVVPCPLKKRKSEIQNGNEITDNPIARSSSPIKDIPGGAKVIPCTRKQMQFDSQSENQIMDDSVVKSLPPIIKDIPEAVKVDPYPVKSRKSNSQIERELSEEVLRQSSNDLIENVTASVSRFQPPYPTKLRTVSKCNVATKDNNKFVAQSSSSAKSCSENINELPKNNLSSATVTAVLPSLPYSKSKESSSKAPLPSISGNQSHSSSKQETTSKYNMFHSDDALKPTSEYFYPSRCGWKKDYGDDRPLVVQTPKDFIDDIIKFSIVIMEKIHLVPQSRSHLINKDKEKYACCKEKSTPSSEEKSTDEGGMNREMPSIIKNFDTYKKPPSLLTEPFKVLKSPSQTQLKSDVHVESSKSRSRTFSQDLRDYIGNSESHLNKPVTDQKPENRKCDRSQIPNEVKTKNKIQSWSAKLNPQVDQLNNATPVVEKEDTIATQFASDSRNISNHRTVGTSDSPTVLPTISEKPSIPDCCRKILERLEAWEKLQFARSRTDKSEKVQDTFSDRIIPRPPPSGYRTSDTREIYSSPSALDETTRYMQSNIQSHQLRRLDVRPQNNDISFPQSHFPTNENRSILQHHRENVPNIRRCKMCCDPKELMEEFKSRHSRIMDVPEIREFDPDDSRDVLVNERLESDFDYSGVTTTENPDVSVVTMVRVLDDIKGAAGKQKCLSPSLNVLNEEDSEYNLDDYDSNLTCHCRKVLCNCKFSCVMKQKNTGSQATHSASKCSLNNVKISNTQLDRPQQLSKPSIISRSSLQGMIVGEDDNSSEELVQKFSSNSSKGYF